VALDASKNTDQHLPHAPVTTVSEGPCESVLFLLCTCCSLCAQQLAGSVEHWLLCLETLSFASQVWPNLGLHYAMVAKLAMFLEKPQAALAAAEAAGNILHITHGSSSCVMQEVMRLRWEAQQELEAFHGGH